MASLLEAAILLRLTDTYRQCPLNIFYSAQFSNYFQSISIVWQNSSWEAIIAYQLRSQLYAQSSKAKVTRHSHKIRQNGRFESAVILKTKTPQQLILKIITKLA